LSHNLLEQKIKILIKKYLNYSYSNYNEIEINETHNIIISMF